MTDRNAGRPGNPRDARERLRRRDRSEIESRLRNHDRTEVEARLRNHDRSLDQHLRNRDKTAAARERALSEAQARSKARAAGADVRSVAFMPRPTRPRGKRRLAIVLASLVSALLIGVVLVPPLAGGVMRTLAEANPDLMRIGAVADAVGSVMNDRPDVPAGTDRTPVEFAIEPGMSSAQITQNLVDRGLVTDRLAFTYVLVTGDGIDRLRSGTHLLNRTMSPRQIAAVLQGEPSVIGGGGVPIALREGLRIEQIVAYLQTLPLENLDIEQFHELALDPPDDLRQKYSWMRVIPADRSVEGFLGSGLFEVPPDVDGRRMLEILLERWQQSPQHDLIAEAESQGKDFYEISIMASIVEREAILEEEKPLIAGVYQNRLDGVGEHRQRTLNADPVLIYAKDTVILRDQHISQWPTYVFWTLEGLGSAAEYELPDDLAGYQVWHARGLPPGPICTPGYGALEAALQPDTDDGYLYFVAKGDGSNSHVFARTYEEHLRNIDIYLRGESAGPGGSPASTQSDIPAEATASAPTIAPTHDPSSTVETEPSQ